MFEVIMPKLGLTMESGVIEKWHKKEGDKIEVGDVLFEVATDKVSLEVESYNSGVLRKILKQNGEEVPVTEIVAYIGDKNEKIPEKIDKDTREMVLEDKTPSQDDILNKINSNVISEDIKVDNKKKIKKERIKISGLAKKIALDNQIDITKINGSGPGGRIIKDDVINMINLNQEAGKDKELSNIE